MNTSYIFQETSNKIKGTKGYPFYMSVQWYIIIMSQSFLD